MIKPSFGRFAWPTSVQAENVAVPVEQIEAPED